MTTRQEMKAEVMNRRRWFLGRTFLVLLVVRLGLAMVHVQRKQSRPFFSFQKLQAYLKSMGTPSSALQEPLLSPEETERLVRQVIWAVERSAGIMPGGAKCLAKALTTQVMLQQRGCDCDFKIGVAKTAEGQLDAHAWIVKDGQVIMGALPDLERFKSFPSLPNFF